MSSGAFSAQGWLRRSPWPWPCQRESAGEPRERCHGAIPLTDTVRMRTRAPRCSVTAGRVVGRFPLLLGHCCVWGLRYEAAVPAWSGARRGCAHHGCVVMRRSALSWPALRVSYKASFTGQLAPDSGIPTVRMRTPALSPASVVPRCAMFSALSPSPLRAVVRSASALAG